MRKSKLHKRLVLDPQKVKEEFDRSPGLEEAGLNVPMMMNIINHSIFVME